MTVGSTHHPAGDAIELRGLSPLIGDNETVRLAYRDPTTGNDINAIQDENGNDTSSFSNVSVTNNSTVTLPKLSAAAVPADGATVVLTFSADLDFPTAFSSVIRGAFTVTVDGTESQTTDFAVSGTTATLTMSDPIVENLAVIVSYDRSDAGSEAIGSTSNKLVADFTTGEKSVAAVVNNSEVDITPPRLSSATVAIAGDRIILDFSENLDTSAAARPPASAFSVSADGASIVVGSVAISSGQKTRVRLLSLDRLIYQGQTVTVTYTDPTSGDDASAIQDSDGNDADSFTTGEDGVPAVTNGSTAVAAPAAPTALTATAFGATAIDLAWTAPDNNGGSAITGYKIEVSTDGSTGSWSDRVADTESTNTDYRHSGLSGGDTRHYRVSAINVNGTSPASAPDSATTGTAAHHAVPATIHGTVLWSAEMTVGTTNVGPGYEIGPPENGLLSASTFNLGGILTVKNIIFIPGRQNLLISFSAPLGLGLFTFHVGPHKVEWSPLAHQNSNTFDNFSNPGWSHDDTVEVRLVRATAPGTPTGLRATASGTTQIDLAWIAPASDGGRAITGYRIEVSENGGTDWTDLEADTGNTDTSYSHTGLAVGDTRHYRVSAINAAGTSGPSDPDAATVTGTQSSDATLSGLTVTGGGSDLVTFVSGTTTYTAMVASTVTEVTVTATKNDTGATIDYLDGDDATITDAGTADGHQVAVAEGDNVIKVKVTAEDGNTTQTYTVTVTRAEAAATAPTITDVAVTSTPAAATDTYGEGETIEVSVTFSEAVTATTGTDFVLSVAGRKRAPLVRGSGTATLVFGYTVLAADEDDNGIWIGDQDRTLVGNRNGDPQNGTITRETTDVEADLTHAALGQQSGHKVDGSLSAVEPEEPPEVTLHLSDADGEVGEDAGAVTVTATVSPASATAFTVTVSASPVAPATDDDFELSTNRALSFDANATASSGTVTITPVDDGDPESNQVVTVSGSASIEGVTDPGDVTLTILDNDLVSIDGICDRTRRVRDRIVELLMYRHSFKGGCGDVNETHLAQLESLDLGRNPSTESAFTMSLKRIDFEGLVNLERLYLRETGLRSLPAGVFAGLAALDTLELDSNQLRSLPAGVFSDLHSLKTLELHRNPRLSSLPYDEFEALPNLTKLLVDPEGRRGYQVAGGEGDVTLEVAAGGRTTYQVRLTHTPAYVNPPPPTLTVSSDTAGVVATPATLRFTKENWFRRQTVTVYAPVSVAGETATLNHTSTGVTYDRPIPTVTVRVLESAPGRSADPLTAEFQGLPSSHDGETAFTFRIAFSEAVAVTPEAMRTRVLTVAGGAVTGAARVDGESGVWAITVAPDSREELSITLAPSAECAADGAVCTSDGRALSTRAAAIVNGPADEPERNTAATGTPTIGGTAQVGEALTASTSDISDADGLDDARFAYQWIRASADIDGATGSTYTPVAADEGTRLQVRVSFTDDAGNEESLTSAATDAVAAAPEPLTASFEGMPAEHAGQGSFSFRVAFSDGINSSYKTVRDASFTVTGGDVTRARRVDKRRDLWEITVEPDSDEAVTVRLPETTDCGARGAICTGDGRPLSHALSATVAGPVGIAVADARVEEGDAAVLAFAVTLSRAASAALTVDYATADGSAHAGDDYRAASGTLKFRAGESSTTIEVAVLDDAHDEGEETLTLRLSTPSGGRLADGEATGTIENHDPMPRALLARFGRTAAVHVVEHVEERLQAPRAPGFRGRFAGRELRRGMERDIALNFLRQLGGMAGATPTGAGVHGSLSGAPAAGTAPLGMPGPAGGGGHLAAASGPMGGAMPMGGAPGARGMAGSPMGGGSRPDGGFNGGGLLRMGLGGGDVLTGSDFALGRETGHGGILSFWSRGAQSRFAGREGALSLGGDVRTTMFGADYAKGPLVTGLSLSHSRGLGEYAGVAGGQVASSVTGLYPWLGYQATERITVWGVAGYGAGGLLLTPEGGPALESGLSMAMAAAGTRGELFAGGGGFELAFKADALWVGTSIDGVDGAAGRLAATAAAVTRFRTGLEGSRDYTLAGRLSLTPSVEVGLRHDGGDAETGAGMDVGGGLVVSDASTGLAVDLRVRMLVMHQAEGFRERGVALSLSYNPTPSTPLGFVARVAPSWGGQATSGAEALWGQETMAGMAHGSLASGNRLDGEVGYGLPVGRRFVGTPTLGVGTSADGRDYRLGYRLGALGGAGTAFELGVEAHRRESPMLDTADNGFLGRATVGW